MMSLKKIGSIFNFSPLFRNGKKAPHLIRADSGIGKLYYKGTNNFEYLINHVILK